MSLRHDQYHEPLRSGYCKHIARRCNAFRDGNCRMQHYRPHGVDGFCQWEIEKGECKNPPECIWRYHRYPKPQQQPNYQRDEEQVQMISDESRAKHRDQYNQVNELSMDSGHNLLNIENPNERNLSQSPKQRNDDSKMNCKLDIDSGMDGHSSYFDTVRPLSLKHNQCHEPLLHLCISNEPHLFNQLPKHHRQEVMGLILDIWTVYNPLNVKMNCGVYQTSNLIFKFRFEAEHHFEEMFHDLIVREQRDQHRRNGNYRNAKVNVLQNQMTHFKATHSEYYQTRERRNLSHIEEDIRLLQHFLTTQLKAELPSKSELDRFGAVRFDEKMQFQHENGLYPFCTALSIRVATQETKETFSMKDYKLEIDDAVEILVQFMDESTTAVKAYISSIIANYKMPESDQWFELSLSAEEWDGTVVIVVECNVSMMHYLFVLLYKFEVDVVRKWMHDYTALIERELKANNAVEYVCDYANHYHLHLAIEEKKLLRTKFIGLGARNHVFRGDRKSLLYRQLPIILPGQSLQIGSVCRNGANVRRAFQSQNGTVELVDGIKVFVHFQYAATIGGTC